MLMGSSCACEPLWAKVRSCLFIIITKYSLDAEKHELLNSDLGSILQFRHTPNLTYNTTCNLRIFLIKN